jgi:hypothetical protein
MESILKTIQSIFPLLGFYPKWAQALFLLTFLLALLSFAIFVISYNKANEDQKQSENQPATKLIEAFSAEHAPFLQLPVAAAPQKIESPTILRSPQFANDFPLIDLKFQNTGKSAEMITRIKLLVRDVKIDIAPSI